jgi:hypothetical protein
VNFHPKLTKYVLAFSFALIVAPSQSFSQMLPEVERKYDYDCNSIIKIIRDDTRNRIAIYKRSIEQVYERKRLSISDNNVSCSGQALFSDGKKKVIQYGGHIDKQGSWVFNYTTP